MLEFVVRVGYTDRVRTYHTFATVLADTDTDAELAAAQMVDTIRRDTCHGYVVSTAVVSVTA